MSSRRQLIDLLSRERIVHARTNQIILAAPMPIAIVDRQFRFIVWNEPMVQSTGVPADEVLGLLAPDRFPMIVTNGALRLLECALDGRISEARHFYTYPATDTRMVSSVQRRPIWNGDRIEGVVAVTSWHVRVHTGEPCCCVDSGS